MMKADNDNRTQMSDLINELVLERQQMWSLYCKVADMKPYNEQQSTQTLLTEFCQILIDYISLGHFSIYRRIAEGNERRSAVLTAAENLYPKIEQTTESAVSFNEKYSKPLNPENLASLETDISQLGEQLAQRDDAEDQLCQAMFR